VSYTRISRIQARNTSTGGGGNAAFQTSGSVTGIEIRDVIADSIGGGGSSFGIVTLNGGSSLINAVVVSRAGGAGIVNGGSGNLILGSTVMRPSSVGAGQTGVVATTGTPTLRSTAVFGFSTAASGLFSAGSSDNATNLASGLPGTGAVYNVPFTTATLASTTADFRAVAGSGLASAGYLDATIAPNDISGTRRAATPAVGAWEPVAVAPSAPKHRVTIQ
jgi:hypothetical protein